MDNGNNKSCSPNLTFLTEKKIKMINLIFDIENWLWKENFGDYWFLTQLTQVITASPINICLDPKYLDSF